MFCNLGLFEDETLFFFFYSPQYNDVRFALFENMHRKKPDLFWMCEGDVLNWLFEYNLFCLATFMEKAWTLSQQVLYSGLC